MRDLWKDVRYGFRNLAARPVVSLALGIGLNTTIFSLVNAALLRPPAVDDPAELVEVYLDGVSMEKAETQMSEGS